ncbi:MAG TPA: PKD domain-containing protein [Candidatus Thermoplasmatota archaeon]|nr:PKD domain-containing protein [Candidatus Thermoplasmatota archaeon]
MPSASSSATLHAPRSTRAPLAALGYALILVLATVPTAAAAEGALPPLGMSVGSIAGLEAAGAAPRYGSYWVGDWMASSGWGGFDSAMKAAKAAGVTPVIYWYYWGDSISPDCVENGCDGRTRSEWLTLTDQLASHVKSTLAGSEALIVLENEFNKGGITGDSYASTFDARLEGVAKTLHAVPGVKLILGFGNWGEANWVKFPKSAAQCEFIGFQMMRASTKDSEASYLGAADRTVVLTNYIASKFNKPSFLYDVALSSYPDDHWADLQAKTLDAIFANLQTSGATGLQGVVYRSLQDHYMSPANYYGYAESHWGLQKEDGTAKPAFAVWLKYAKASAPAPTPAPATPNVPGSFEAESMTATKGGRVADASASGDAYWNLWANGTLTTTLVSDGASAARITIRASGQPAGGIAPHMDVRLNGAILRGFDVASGFASYAVDVTIPNGSSTLAIAFTNDQVVSGVDRNLLLDVATVGAQPVNAAPNAAFAHSEDALAVSVDASASTDADGDALTYAWSFGDGASATGRTAAHAYAAAGSYAVRLTVSDGAASDVASATVSVVRPNTAPVARMSATVTDLSVAVSGADSSDADGDALTYAWSFGDGSSATGRTASHTYAAAGTYTIRMTVSDAEASSSASQTVTAIQPNRAPTAAIAVTGSLDSYSFSASGSSDPDGDALSFGWAFGDGSTATGASVSHTYATAGSYTVTLTASDGRGASDGATTSVAATKPAPIAFNASFVGLKGNAWWVQTGVTANKALSGVCAIVNGSACKPLTNQTYGWSASFAVANGTLVSFRATATTGETVTSGKYVWPSATPVANATATFTPYDGNTNWVQTKVTASQTVKSVCATLNGGACKALTYRSWGAWAAGMSAPTGTKVVFFATLADGSVVKSATYTWPVR